LGWLVAASRNCIALSCVAVGLDLLSLLGAADLVAVAWPVSGILVGWPIVRGGQRRPVRRQLASSLYRNRGSWWFHEVTG
jgi:hypothetical protein